MRVEWGFTHDQARDFVLLLVAQHCTVMGESPAALQPRPHFECNLNEQQIFVSSSQAYTVVWGQTRPVQFEQRIAPDTHDYDSAQGPIHGEDWYVSKLYKPEDYQNLYFRDAVQIAKDQMLMTTGATRRRWLDVLEKLEHRNAAPTDGGFDLGGWRSLVHSTGTPDPKVFDHLIVRRSPSVWTAAAIVCCVERWLVVGRARR